jgi:hypothetical protein
MWLFQIIPRPGHHIKRSNTVFGQIYVGRVLAAATPRCEMQKSKDMGEPMSLLAVMQLSGRN